MESMNYPLHLQPLEVLHFRYSRMVVRSGDFKKTGVGWKKVTYG